MSSQGVCVVAGVGPGTGAAAARRFAEGGYRVAMLGRGEEPMTTLERELPGAKAYRCDIADAAQVGQALAAIERDLGAPTVLIQNAAAGAFGSFLDVDPQKVVDAFQVNAMGLLHLARRVAPAMIAAGGGAILVTGNTASQRGRPNFVGLAPTKAAQRILAEVIARELGPKGVHVAYVVIDAVIDTAPGRAHVPDRPDEFYMKPEAIADEFWHLAHQDPSAWSFNVELRPFGERW